MLIPSILFLMTLNTFAASGAALVALQVSAFETPDRLTPSPTLASSSMASDFAVANETWSPGEVC